MIDIRMQIFEQVYTQCQLLLVPEFTEPVSDITANPDVVNNTPSTLTSNDDLFIPTQFKTDSTINDLTDTDIQSEYPEVITKYPGTYAEKGPIWKLAIRQRRNQAFIDHENYITETFPMFGERIVRYLRPDAEPIDNLQRDNALPALMIAIGSNFRIGQDAQQPTSTTLNTKEKSVALKIRLALTETSLDDRYDDTGTNFNLQNARTGRAFHVWGQLRQVLDIAFFPSTSATFPQYQQKSEILKTELTETEVEKTELENTVLEYLFQATFREQITR